MITRPVKDLDDILTVFTLTPKGVQFVENCQKIELPYQKIFDLLCILEDDQESYARANEEELWLDEHQIS